jgi:uncharacterized protein (TIGR02145 family)
MAVNLDIDDGGEGIYNAEIVSEDNVNFGIQYYYTWDAAIRISNKINGWHLPSKSEWDTLINTVGGSPGGSYVWNLAGKKLKSTTGWSDNGNGTNEYGFNVLPVGERTQSGSLYDIGYCTGFWTSTENGNDVYSIKLDSDTSQALRILNQTNKQSFINIRLIKD